MGFGKLHVKDVIEIIENCYLFTPDTFSFKHCFYLMSVIAVMETHVVDPQSL